MVLYVTAEKHWADITAFVSFGLVSTLLSDAEPSSLTASAAGFHTDSFSNKHVRKHLRNGIFMYSNCKQHWRLRKFVSRNLDSLVHCTGCWHTGMNHNIQEDQEVLGYPSFQDDQGDQEGLLNL